MVQKAVLIYDGMEFSGTKDYVHLIMKGWEVAAFDTNLGVDNYLKFMDALRASPLERAAIFINAHGGYLADGEESRYLGFVINDPEGHTAVPPDYFFDQITGLSNQTSVFIDSCGSCIYLEYAQEHRPQKIVLLATSDSVKDASLAAGSFDIPRTGQLIFHMYRYTYVLNAFLPFDMPYDLVHVIESIIRGDDLSENDIRKIRVQPGIYKTVDKYLV